MTVVPPQSVATIAKRALGWRKTFGRGGTMIGVARARDLANRRPLSERTLARMASYFARHKVDRNAIGFFSGERGFPSAGRIAWDLWGGDAGAKWLARVIKSLKR